VFGLDQQPLMLLECLWYRLPTIFYIVTVASKDLTPKIFPCVPLRKG